MGEVEEVLRRRRKVSDGEPNVEEKTYGSDVDDLCDGSVEMSEEVI